MAYGEGTSVCLYILTHYNKKGLQLVTIGTHDDLTVPWCGVVWLWFKQLEVKVVAGLVNEWAWIVLSFTKVVTNKSLIYSVPVMGITKRDVRIKI